MKKIKNLIPVIIAILLLSSVVVGVNLLRNPNSQTVRSEAQESGLKVSFSPSSLAGINKESEFNVDLILSTTGKLISSVDIELKYLNNLELVDFREDSRNSGLDTSVIPGIPDNFSKTFRYAAVNKGGNLPLRQTLKLGTLRFKVSKDSPNGPTTVEVIKATVTVPGEKGLIEPSLDKGFYTIGITSQSPSTSADPSSPASSNACINGAVKGNSCVSNIDFVEWFKEWSGLSQTKNADFFPECNENNQRGDGIIDIADFEVWRRESNGVNKCQ